MCLYFVCVRNAHLVRLLKRFLVMRRKMSIKCDMAVVVVFVATAAVVGVADVVAVAVAVAVAVVAAAVAAAVGAVANLMSIQDEHNPVQIVELASVETENTD